MINLPPDKIVTVVRAVFRFENKYLVLEQKNASGNTYLLFPGGHVNAGESLTTALNREITEELNIKSFSQNNIIFIKETKTPFDRAFEYFFECETKMAISDIKVLQDKYTGYEKIEKCLLLNQNELKNDKRFFPKNFFARNNYQYLELALDQYRQLYGNDRNILSLNL